MYCQEQSRRDAEYAHKSRMQALRNVRKSTIHAAFMKGESVWDLARRYGITMGDVENAIRHEHAQETK